MGSLGCLLMFGRELLPEVRDLSYIALFVILHIPVPEVSIRMIRGNLDSVVSGIGGLPYWFLRL